MLCERHEDLAGGDEVGKVAPLERAPAYSSSPQFAAR